MKISNNWLKQYVAHDLSPEALADLLTMSGLEVEDIETVGSSLDGVVVGHVLDVQRHPNADRLTVCQVDLGQGEPVQIICGAPNVAAGQNVPVATVGTTLMLPSRDNPEERVAIKLKKAKMRGEASHGMICAEDELGLSDDHSGIMVLPQGIPAGQPFQTYIDDLGLTTQDTVFDIAITPNRPDAISHIGVARDVAALTERPFTRPDVALPEDGGEAAAQVAVEIVSPEACGRYVGILVRGITIKASPPWLQQRLTAIGLRPRNNVVDITNYVMHECGQPLHAFDYDQISGHKIIVRLTEQEQPFTTLDSKERTLPVSTLMICDAERDVAIGGVMGGENSEVTETTTNVLIESAYFDPSSIRKTAKALTLQTDASYRFERGVDPEGQVWAAARAAMLMAQLADGEIVPGMVDAHPAPVEQRSISLRPSRITKVLGIEVPRTEAVRLLRDIGFSVEEAEETLRCTVPSYRPDVEREIDVIEEVARLYGYDRIPDPEHSALPNVTPHDRPISILRQRVLARLSSLGYREIYTNSMQRKETAVRFYQPSLFQVQQGLGIVETLNPISQEMTALRPSLLPGMLQVMAHNQNHGQQLLRFLEFGHVFNRTAGPTDYIPGYAEHESLLIGLSGLRTEAGWDHPETPSDFFDLKGLVEMLLKALGITGVEMKPVYEPTPMTSYHLSLVSGSQHLGIVAQLSDAYTRDYDLRNAVYFASLNWDMLVARAADTLKVSYKAISRFPIVERDLAVVIQHEQAVGPLLDTIEKAGRPLLLETRVFDLYEGDRIEAGNKSIAFSLRLGANRTLKDKEVDRRMAAIIDQLAEQHHAHLRQ